MTETTLADLGWSDHFQRQLSTDDTGEPMRIHAVNRRDVEALSTHGSEALVTKEETGTFAVGDWVIADGARVLRLLDRTTLIKRLAAGDATRPQLIAANVDTLAIVTSCNDDFNVARLERYLAMALSAGCTPLVVLTKADQSDDPDSYRKAAEAMSPLVTAIALDARDPEESRKLEPWCRQGQTLALVGSSGVGKTTIQNALTGIEDDTQGIREDDAKGRHTTTARALRPTLAGGWLVDTPGMRELRLSEAADGIEAVFADIAEIAASCRFSDCKHETEPGCAIKAALESGDIDPDRLRRWQKLEREEQHNAEAIHVAHARFKRLGKQAKSGKARGDWKRGGWTD